MYVDVFQIFIWGNGTFSGKLYNWWLPYTLIEIGKKVL